MIPKYGIWGYVLSLITAYLITAFYSIIFSRSFKYIDIKKASFQACREMFKFSVPLVPIILIQWFTNGLSRPMMAETLGMYSLGIFAVANKFAGVIQMLFTIFEISWQSSALEEFGKESYQDFFNKVFRLITSGLLFMLFIAIFSRQIIVRVFTTREYYSASKYIPLLILAIIIHCLGFFTGSNFYVMKKSKLFFFPAMIMGITSLILYQVLIPRFGILGTALSLICSYLISLITSIFLCRKYVKIINVHKYILLFAVCCAAIIVDFNIPLLLVKYGVIFGLFIAFLLINRELKSDVFIAVNAMRAKLMMLWKNKV
jgi:O-antigen/teichoic acid export membrane protein